MMMVVVMIVIMVVIVIIPLVELINFFVAYFVKRGDNPLKFVVILDGDQPIIFPVRLDAKKISAFYAVVIVFRCFVDGLQYGVPPVIHHDNIEQMKNVFLPILVEQYNFLAFFFSHCFASGPKNLAG